MAKRRATRQSNAGHGAVVKVAKVIGQPGAARLKRPWGRKTVFHRLVDFAPVKTLIKTSPADGLSGKDARTITTAHGVRTPGGGGWLGGATVFSKAPNLTPKPARATKRVATPRPAPGGVRSPFKLSQREGRTNLKGK